MFERTRRAKAAFAGGCERRPARLRASRAATVHSDAWITDGFRSMRRGYR
jgi:hypothetical protein